MNTFSDLPRYPTDSIDRPDGPSESDGAIRFAVTIAQYCGELLFLATPIFAIMWLIVCLPILLALLISAETCDERR